MSDNWIGKALVFGHDVVLTVVKQTFKIRLFISNINFLNLWEGLICMERR